MEFFQEPTSVFSGISEVERPSPKLASIVCGDPNMLICFRAKRSGGGGLSPRAGGKIAGPGNRRIGCA
jgi:hypothetical protein